MQSTTTPNPGAITARPVALRWGVHGALVGAAALTFAGAIAVMSPWAYPGPEGSWAWTLIESADVVGELGILAALVAVHVSQRERSSRVGTAGFWLSAVGTVLFVVSTLLWLLPPADGVVLDVLFIGALVGWLLGLPLLGAGTLRAAVLPGWCGWVLLAYAPVFLLAFVLVEVSSWARAPIGLPWLAVAYALSSVGPPARAAGTGQVGG